MQKKTHLKIMETITIPTNKGLQFYDIDNIIHIECLSNYCKIYFADHTHPLTIAKVLHWFEEQLPVTDFWRTHKTHLVNSRYIKKLHISQKSSLLLQNGEMLLVSRRRVPFLKKIINKAA